MRASRLSLHVALAVVLSSAVGCSARTGSGALGGADSGGPAQGAPVPRVVFDMAHGEIFGAQDTSDLGQSQAVQHIRDAGFEVKVNAEPLTAERLAGAAGVILPGPMRPLVVQEQQALKDYIKQGGTVLMTVHVPFPVLSVPQAFGLKSSTYVLETTMLLPGISDPSVLLADQVAPDPITKGVGRLLVLSGWGVEPVASSARRVVSTDDSAWMDVDRDNTRTAKDPKGPFGVVGVSDFGAGSFILVGDDAIFANVGIGQADNAMLLDNVLQLMAERTKAT